MSFFSVGTHRKLLKQSSLSLTHLSDILDRAYRGSVGWKISCTPILKFLSHACLPRDLCVQPNLCTTSEFGKLVKFSSTLPVGCKYLFLLKYAKDFFLEIFSAVNLRFFHSRFISQETVFRRTKHRHFIILSYGIIRM